MSLGTFWCCGECSLRPPSYLKNQHGIFYFKRTKPTANSDLSQGITTLEKHRAENQQIRRRYFSFLKEAGRNKCAGGWCSRKGSQLIDVHTNYKDFKVFNRNQVIASWKLPAGPGRVYRPEERSTLLVRNRGNDRFDFLDGPNIVFIPHIRLIFSAISRQVVVFLSNKYFLHIIWKMVRYDIIISEQDLFACCWIFT